MNKCTTTKIDKEGNEVVKNKLAFVTLDSAIKHAKEMNIKSTQIEKLVAYKCVTCFRYHVGRNGNIIKDKERDQFKKDLEKPMRFKVLGKIDLSMIPKK